jgi:hypothetical protein
LLLYGWDICSSPAKHPASLGEERSGGEHGRGRGSDSCDAAESLHGNPRREAQREPGEPGKQDRITKKEEGGQKSHLRQDRRIRRQVKQGHLTTPNGVFGLCGAVGGDEIVGDGDDGQKKRHQKNDGDYCTPSELCFPAKRRSYPEEDKGNGDGQPQRIEKQLHLGFSI